MMTPFPQLKLRQTFRQNGARLIPYLLEQFLSWQKKVVRREDEKENLHEMRLAGKRLRYVLEIYRPVYGKTFAACLKEITGLLDIMGAIHECDVADVVLRDYLEEVKVHNQVIADQAHKLSIAVIQDLIRKEHSKRKHLFMEMQKILWKWESERFKINLSDIVKSA